MGECIVVADFGLGRTKIGAYRKTNGKYELFSGSIFDTPEGGLGEPETFQTFSLALEKLAVKGGLLYVLFPRDEKNVVCGEANYPMGSGKEIEKIIKNNLSTFIPEEEDQFHYDWRLLEAYSSGQGRFQVAAIRSSYMDMLHKMAEHKHLKLRYADLNENAVEYLAKLLRRDSKYGISSTGDATAVVEVGHKTARVVVVTKDRIIQNETISHNLYRLDKILAGNMGDMENDPSVSPELLKLNPSYVGKISQYQSFLGALSTEVIRVIKQSISGENRYHLTNIYFTGGLYKIPQLVSTVKNSFEVPCFAYPLSDFLQVNDNCISRGNRKPYPSPDVFAASLGDIVDLLEQFKQQPTTLMMPKMPNGSFAKKLYSLYLTYLPTDKFKYALKMNVDNRGSFTEFLHTADCGQVSVNISKPGITKGQHWHNSKWELFIVVAGHGLIQERNISTGETVEFEVSGYKIEAVHMIPGWTHNIINLSDTENLVTVMTCNEIFDPNKPDTFFEEV